ATSRRTQSADRGLAARCDRGGRGLDGRRRPLPRHRLRAPVRGLVAHRPAPPGLRRLRRRDRRPDPRPRPHHQRVCRRL
ncbi:MAG: YrbA protein, partial [uncultured Solirubrobacteraceae bacterium]